MNNLTNFLALTGAIFGAITALLVLLSRLEPSRRTQKARPSVDTLPRFQEGVARRRDDVRTPPRWRGDEETSNRRGPKP